MLDHFARASWGDVDLRFWRDIYQRHKDASGSYDNPVNCLFDRENISGKSRPMESDSSEHDESWCK